MGKTFIGEGALNKREISVSGIDLTEIEVASYTSVVDAVGDTVIDAVGDIVISGAAGSRTDYTIELVKKSIIEQQKIISSFIEKVGIKMSLLAKTLIANSKLSDRNGPL